MIYYNFCISQHCLSEVKEALVEAHTDNDVQTILLT